MCDGAYPKAVVVRQAVYCRTLTNAVRVVTSGLCLHAETRADERWDVTVGAVEYR